MHCRTVMRRNSCSQVAGRANMIGERDHCAPSISFTIGCVVRGE